MKIALFLLLLTGAASSTRAQPARPMDFGSEVEGFQDAFTLPVRNPAWSASLTDVFVAAEGILRIGNANGDPNYLLLDLPGYNSSIQEVLARIRVIRFGWGDGPRGGLGTVVSGRGVSFHFRNFDGTIFPTPGVTTVPGLDLLPPLALPAVPELDAANAVAFPLGPGMPGVGTHMELLRDGSSWGPELEYSWHIGQFYWLRMRHDPNSGGGTNDVFAKVWRADGVTPEPSEWQLQWNYSAPQSLVVPEPGALPIQSGTLGLRQGLAGISAGSSADGGAISELECDFVLIKAEGLPKIRVAAPPEILNISPANRSVFANAAQGLQFDVASAFGVVPAEIKVSLNGEDRTADLILTDASDLITDSRKVQTGHSSRYRVELPGLAPNQDYLAVLRAADSFDEVTTVELRFSTYTENAVTVIEAEDYNYEGGKFPAASGVNQLVSKAGVQGIDHHELGDAHQGPQSHHYRSDETGISPGTDEVRSSFSSGGADYLLSQVAGGEWQNYTRTILPGRYRMYLRAATENLSGFRLNFDRIHGTSTGPQQTLFPLGQVLGSSTGGEGRFSLFPVTDAFGKPLSFIAGAQTTLRQSIQSGNPLLNYILLVPESGGTALGPYVSRVEPPIGTQLARPDESLKIWLSERETGAALASILLEVDGKEVTSSVTKQQESGGVFLEYPLLSAWTPGVHQVRLVFQDNANPPIARTNEWSFSVSNPPVIPAGYSQQVSPRVSGFNLRLVQAPERYPFGEVPRSSVARAELQLQEESPIPVDFSIEDTAPRVNHNQTGGLFQGFFGNELQFPGLALHDDHFAVEILCYLELPRGTHRFGIHSDEGFRLTTGPSLDQITALELARFDGARPSSDTEFEFFVEADGLYPFRLVYFETEKEAHVEWYSVEPETGHPLLLNSEVPGSLRAYRALHLPAELILVDPRRASSGFEFSFPIESGKTYTVEGRPSLTDGSWEPLFDLEMQEENGLRTIRDPADGDVKFYRVRVD